MDIRQSIQHLVENSDKHSYTTLISVDEGNDRWLTIKVEISTLLFAVFNHDVIL